MLTDKAMEKLARCKAIECTKRASVRGLCDTHYRRLLRHGDPNVSMNKPQEITTDQERMCSVTGCSRVKSTMGMCQMHYVRLRRTGKTTRKPPSGVADNPLYNAWSAMIQRCENPNNPQYKNYGARGIKVCDQWHDFRKFYSDMGDRPKGKTLDRIDNDGDYSAINCRWVTMAEQNINRRDTERFDCNGELLTIQQMANKYKITTPSLRYRMNIVGLSPSDAASIPKTPGKKLAKPRRDAE